MRFALCDDRIEDAIELKDMLLDNIFFAEAEISIFESGASLIEQLDEGENFDVYFLDIDMPDLDGLSLAAKINKYSEKSIIVFFTAFPEYAVEAFECDAFHYLLKPLDREKVKKVLSKIERVYKEKNKFHIIKNRLEIQKINISDIYYVECFRRHLIYHLSDRRIETVGKLSSAYDELRPHGFYQIHQGFVVNMDKICRFEKDSVILDDGRRVMVSNRRRSDAMIAYSKFVERGTL